MRISSISILALLLWQTRFAQAAAQQTLIDENASVVAAAEGKSSSSALRVCRRPLPRWIVSRNWFLKALNRLVVRHIHHSYVDFGEEVSIPGTAITFRTIGIHPVDPNNKDKEPLLDQITDTLQGRGECKLVKDATEEKLQRLVNEVAAGVCYSCGRNYHNHALTGCYNNSNTYVYDLISGAGMKPPAMKGAPGYRKHHTCHF